MNTHNNTLILEEEFLSICSCVSNGLSLKEYVSANSTDLCIQGSMLSV